MSGLHSLLSTPFSLPKERKRGPALYSTGDRTACLPLLLPLGCAVPLLGAALQKPFREYLEAQKAKLHHVTGEGTPTEESWLSWLFEKVVVIMVCFFVCSIVNSMAQSYAKRKRQEKSSDSKTE